MNLPENFRIFLISQKSSPATIKNYLADINNFFNWLAQTTGIRYQVAGPGIFSLFTEETIAEYQQYLLTASAPPSTINRRLSALRKLEAFAKQNGWLTGNPTEKIPNLDSQKPVNRTQILEKTLADFRQNLEKVKASPLTIKNYLCDVRHFLNWRKNNPQQSINYYQKELTDNFSLSTAKRRTSGIKQFLHWLENQDRLAPKILARPFGGLAYRQVSSTRPWKMGLGIAVVALLFFIATRFFTPGIRNLLNQLSKGQTTSPVIATSYSPWIIAFKGKLTEGAIDQAKVVFRLYEEEIGGEFLWQSKTWELQADPKGEFEVLLGDVSQGDFDLPSQLFFQKENLYLGMSVNDLPENSPRLPISTAGYITDSAKLGGFSPSQSPIGNIVPALTKEGYLILAAASPKIKSTQGTFSIEGQAISLITPPGSDGSIILAPDGSGVLNLTLSSSTGNLINATDANLGVSGSKEQNTLYYGQVANDNTNYNLLKLESGSTPTTKFSVDASGNTDIAGNLQINGYIQSQDANHRIIFNTVNNLFEIREYGDITLSAGVATGSATNTLFLDNSGKIGIGTTNPAAGLDVGGGSAQLANGTNDLLVKGNLEVDKNIRIDGGKITTSVNTEWDLTNPSTTALNIESGLLNLDTTNSRVGVGTTAPAYTLDIIGSASVSSNLYIGQSLTVRGTTLATTGNIETTGNLTVEGNTILGNAISDWATVSGTLAINLRDNTTDALDIQESTNNYINIDTTDSNEVVALGSASFNPDFNVNAGQFLIDGNGNITLNPAGNGDVYFHGSIYNLSDSGDLTLGGRLTFENEAYLQNETDGILYFNEPTLQLAASTALDIDSPTLDLSTQAVSLNLADSSTTSLNIESGLLNLDTQSSRVGIGTTAPGYKLDVVGTASISGQLNMASPIIPYTTDQFDLGSSSNYWARVYANNVYAPATGIQGYWQRNSQAISPTNITDDLLVGGTATASAKFQVFGSGSNAGSATMSGNLVLAGGSRVISGTSMNTLQIGDASTGLIYIPGNFKVDGNVLLGSSTANTFGVSSYITSDLVPDAGLQYNFGSNTRRWLNVWAGTVTASNLSGTVISGMTSANDWLINSDNTTVDTEDSTLTFQRGSPAVNAEIRWDSSEKYLSTNVPSLVISADSGIAYSGKAALIVNQIQNQDILTASASGITKLSLDRSGNLTLAGNLISPATGTSGYWQRALGALSPTNITDDLLVGVTATPSATSTNYFQVFGTGTTSGDASSSGNLTLGTNRAAGIIETERMIPLTLGSATTGEIQFYSSANKLNSSGNLTLAGTISDATWNGVDIDISDYTNLSATSGIVLTGDQLTHSTANGYVHIPADGSSIQILQYASAGTAKWITVSGDVVIADNGAAAIQPNSVALTTDTSGDYVAGLTEGTAIDITGSTGEGWSPTVAFDSTELGTTVWGAGSTITWTFNASGGTSPQIGFGDNYVNFATGNIGVGTTAPIHQLDVSGRINQSWNYFFEDFFGYNYIGSETYNLYGRIHWNEFTGCIGVTAIATNGIWTNTPGGSGWACFLDFADTNAFDDANYPIIETAVKVEATTDNTVYAGFSDRVANATADPANGVYFKFSAGGNWLAITRSSSTETSTDTGVVPSTSAFQTLRIEHSTSSVKFYIDGVLEATHTTNIPTASLDLDIMNKADNAATHRLYLDYIKIWQDWPTGNTILTQEETKPRTENLAAFADLAENYLVDDQILIGYGEIVSLDTERKGYVKQSSIPYDPVIAGINSEKPSLAMGQVSGRSISVGLNGRLEVKVSSLNGLISAGDPITSSQIPGVGMKATKAGQIIGKALEPYSNIDPQAIGKILVYVNPSWYDPEVYLTSTGDLQIVRNDFFFKLIKNSTGEIIEKVGTFANLIAAQIKTGLIETKEVKTETISPLSEGGDVIIKLSDLPSFVPTDVGASEGRSKFKIINEQNVEVASIDSAGNVKASSIEVDSAHVLNNATVSGTLYANKIIADEIEKPDSAEATSGEASESGILSEEEVQAMVDEILNTPVEATTPAQLEENLIIAGSLNVGATLVLANNSINSLTDTLYLQNLGLAGIDLLAGKIRIDSRGNAVFEGNISVKGRLAVSEIEPLAGNDLTVNLNSGFGKLLVKGVNNEIVASISASGSAKFADITTQKITIASADPGSSTQPDPGSGSTITTNATAGEATLPANELEMTIMSPFVTDNTLVYLTPTSDPQNKVIYVKAKKTTPDSGSGGTDDPGSSMGWFKVGLDKPIDVDIKFNWWLIN